jgi:hypothetical protein
MASGVTASQLKHRQAQHLRELARRPWLKITQTPVTHAGFAGLPRFCVTLMTIPLKTPRDAECSSGGASKVAHRGLTQYRRARGTSAGSASGSVKAARTAGKSARRLAANVEIPARRNAQAASSID